MGPSTGGGMAFRACHIVAARLLVDCLRRQHGPALGFEGGSFNGPIVVAIAHLGAPGMVEFTVARMRRLLVARTPIWSKD